MKEVINTFDEQEVLHNLKHFLPAQALLKDFIHHNTLHAFQTQKFHNGVQNASAILGYKISLSLDEYCKRFNAGQIDLLI